ncbi:hypothetical protein D3C76_637500 [compost metagenome]
MHLLVIGRFLVHRQLQVTANQRQLTMSIAPLAQPQVVQELLAAPVAQRVGSQRLALFLEAAPQVDQRSEVRVHVLPLCVRLVGGLLAFWRAFTRVLHRQRTGDDQHFLQAAQARAFKQHAAQPRVDRQARQLAANWRQLVLAVNRRKLLQQVEAVADGFAIRRLDEREGIDCAQAQVQHLQDHRRQVGAQNLRVGKRWPAVEVLFAVETHANARLDPAATAFTLVGTGL